MKILCALSGLEFTCEHFPGTFHTREANHPIFQLPQKKLLASLGKWSSGELTQTDSYLLFIALLHSTELVHFRTSIYRTEKTDALIANNMESLARAIIKMNAIRDTEKVFPSYVITPDTRTLENVRYWINNWLDEYTNWKDGYKSVHDSQKLIRRESALERLIKNPHKPVSSYAAQIADWAAVAGEFPTYLVTSPFSGMKITMADYWKSLIVKCTKSETLFSVPKVDLQDMIEHCQVNIPAGSIYSYALQKILKGAAERQDNWLGLGDSDLKVTTYEILTESSSVEDANIRMMIDAAPKELPRREQYESNFKFIQAKARWDMAQRYGKKDQGDSNESI